MPPEEFITKTHALLSMMRYGLLLAAMFFLAQGFGALPWGRPSAPQGSTTSDARNAGTTEEA